MINKFFGVTMHVGSGNHSIYEVILGDEKATAQKIQGGKVKGREEKGEGFGIGDCLANGSILGIMSDCRGFVMYDQGHRKERPDGVNTIMWGGNTTPLVGLFRNQEDALKCSESPDLTCWDQRFVESSIEVIKEIALAEEGYHRIRLDSQLKKNYDSDQLAEYLLALSQKEW